MKRTFFIMIALAFAWTAQAAYVLPKTGAPATALIPTRFLSTSETAVLEWGCPVSEVVAATSGNEALQKIGLACMEEARQAAHQKPGVFEVINVSVTVPSVDVTPHPGGFMLKGTFFLETLVMKGME